MSVPLKTINDQSEVSDEDNEKNEMTMTKIGLKKNKLSRK